MSTFSFDNYTPMGDMAVIAICCVIVILLMTSYVSRTRSYWMFLTIIVSLVIASALNIFYHGLLEKNDPGLNNLIYTLRILYHAFLFNVFFLFTLYTTEVASLEHHKARTVAIISTALLVLIVGIDIYQTLTGVGFRITADGAVTNRSNLFIVGNILYIILLAVLMYRVQHLVYRRIIYGFYGTMAISVLIRFSQLPMNQSSLTTMTFVFPVIAMLYIIHSNPYNVSLGSVDIHAMEDMVRSMYTRKEAFIFLSLLLPEYDVEGKGLPEEVSALIRSFAANYFRGGVLFQISNGHVVLVVPKRRNPDCERQVKIILEGFQEQYQRFHSPYKIVIGESIEELSRKNEYASMIRSVERTMSENTVRRVGPDDIARFNRDEYILQELTDIYNKKDIDDPRVLAYCQPVFNLQTGKFDKAEALMRLNLEKIGLVLPDQFIPMAENHGYIHVLTEIILNKTCREIRRLTEEGLHIDRVSVNVSVLELKDSDFCGDIRRIIGSNSVSGEKIALELTESHSEADFVIMKKKLEELRRQGIQFYLDDFGTGYSNMERIMELPFDIIKFDRTMVVASGADERSARIVENLAHMFEDMDYSVLYEGVENESDEERCREMSASYLQGFKYSRPVPIERLREFLPDAG